MHKCLWAQPLAQHKCTPGNNMVASRPAQTPREAAPTCRKGQALLCARGHTLHDPHLPRYIRAESGEADLLFEQGLVNTKSPQGARERKRLLEVCQTHFPRLADSVREHRFEGRDLDRVLGSMALIWARLEPDTAPYGLMAGTGRAQELGEAAGVRSGDTRVERGKTHQKKRPVSFRWISLHFRRGFWHDMQGGSDAL